MRRRLSSLVLVLAACGTSDGTTNPPDQCVNISGTITVGGLEVRKPEADAAGCKKIVDVPGEEPKSHCEKKVPDLSCVGMSAPRTTPINVTFRGCVTTFGLGGESVGLTVAVFREKKADGNATDPGYDISGAPGMQAENTPSALVGKFVSTQVAETDCPDRGHFEIPNVPTETDLVVRVAQQTEPGDNRESVDTYQYNKVLRSASIVDDMGRAVASPETACAMPNAKCYVVDDVNTIKIATFRTIPRAAGVSVISGENNLADGMGEGHIAGEIQDCTSDDKIQNAVVAISAQARKLAYFNVDFPGGLGDLEDPKPSSTRTRTNADGLYSAIGVTTQRGGTPVTVAAALTRSVCGADGVCMCNPDNTPNAMWSAADAGEAEVTALGAKTVYVFPDSITIMTFDRESYVRP